MALVTATEASLVGNGGARTLLGNNFQIVVVIDPVLLTAVNFEEGGLNDAGLVFDQHDGGLDETLQTHPKQRDGGLDTVNL